MSRPDQARAPLWADATFHTTSTAAQRAFSINKPLFLSPAPAGRKITAGFSWMQRIGKTASMDVWFPEVLKQELNAVVQSGKKLGPANFPAEWAAVRQFELLQEAGNYKIYDMDAAYFSRTLLDLSKNMRSGGYRVTVATIGSFDHDTPGDDLEILDRRLQDRISRLTHMLYLEDQSEKINAAMQKVIDEGRWDYHATLPHIGLTLNARELFGGKSPKVTESLSGQKHIMAQQFFDILSLLPQKHITHDTAIGLQLPESIAEHEWIYVAEGEFTVRAFNLLLGEIFTPFDKKVNLSRLNERESVETEIKTSVQHMRGYGDRLTPEADQFHRDAAKFTLQ